MNRDDLELQQLGGHRLPPAHPCFRRVAAAVGDAGRRGRRSGARGLTHRCTRWQAGPTTPPLDLLTGEEGMGRGLCRSAL